MVHNASFSPGGCPTSQAFKGYLKGSLSTSEKFKVEEHLRHCRICSEALEGYKRNRGNEFLQSDLDFLSGKIRKRYASRLTPKVRFPVITISVLLVFVMIFVIIFYIIKYLLLNQ